jgi:cell fate regulator YaaT (PSP1 superfamily)
MNGVVSIRFKPCGKLYDFFVENIELRIGDLVVVESDFGLNIARVVHIYGPEAAEGRELKRVVRKATEFDLQQRQENKVIENEARIYCNERIMARGLPMKLITTESTLDRKRIIFYFSADGRIDFRELVKDLAAKFKTRIEMRQIGVRDESKLIGGLGVCGRELCCKTFLTSFEPISIRMAKKQEMVLNVGKLSGLCSRLMCCLRYEYDGPVSPEGGQDDEVPLEDEVLQDSVESVKYAERKTQHYDSTPEDEGKINNVNQRDTFSQGTLKRKKRVGFNRDTSGAETLLAKNLEADKTAPHFVTDAPQNGIVQGGLPACDSDRKDQPQRRRRRRSRKRRLNKE